MAAIQRESQRAAAAADRLAREQTAPVDIDPSPSHNPTEDWDSGDEVESTVGPVSANFAAVEVGLYLGLNVLWEVFPCFCLPHSAGYLAKYVARYLAGYLAGDIWLDIWPAGYLARYLARKSSPISGRISAQISGCCSQ